MRHAGLGWSNGPAAEALYLRDGIPLLMLESEYKWHAAKAVAGGRPVLFRAMPGVPSSFGWDARRYAARIMETLPAEATDLAFANEGNLNYERADNDDDWDWSAFPQRYRSWSAFVVAVAKRIRGTYGWRGRLHWPAWSPGHGIRETVDVWRDAATAFDVIDFHAYDSAESIEDEYRWFRATFPNHPLWLTEWNTAGGRDVDEDRRALEALARLCAEDEQLHAFYFIGKWFYYPGMQGHTSALDVEGNADRLALFQNPPAARQPAPEPIPVPEPEPITMPPDHAWCTTDMYSGAGSR